MKIRYKKIIRPTDLSQSDLIKNILRELDRPGYYIATQDTDSVEFGYNIWRFGSRNEGESLNSSFFNVFILSAFLFNSCVLDWKADIAVVKNNTPSRILIAKLPTQIMTDSILYNERFSENWIDANKFQTISLPNTSLSSKPDSEKAYLYVFNCDSVHKYQKLQKMNGIIQHSFKVKIEIQLNRVKEPLDTIFVR